MVLRKVGVLGDCGVSEGVFGAFGSISASVLTSDPYTESAQVQPDVNTLTRNAANQAYETAGVDPKDLDLVELHDCFATAELIHYDHTSDELTLDEIERIAI